MIRRLALLLLTLTVFAAPPAWAIFSVLGFKNSMVEFLLDQLSTEGEFEITAESVEEPETGVTAITGLKIADSEGVWFTAESLDFAWSPSRLLSGEVEFSRLAMSGVQILRKPVAKIEADVEETTGPATDEPFDWPRSPLTLRIDQIALTRVEIAEAVLGHALSFDAEGAARDEGDIQSARLALRRTDRVEGTIDFDYARNFAENTLAVNLAAAEAPGGLIATLGDLPEGSPTELTLRADGPPTDWRAVFELALADLVWADGEAAISYEGPIKVDAAFAVRPGTKLDPDIAAVLGAEAALIAKAAEGSDGTILIEDGRIASPNVNLIASGQFNRNTNAADLALDLSATEGLAKPFDGIDFGGLSFKGRVTGAPGSYAVDGDATLDRLLTEFFDVEYAETKLDIRQTGPEGAPVTEISSTGLTRGLRIDRLGADLIGEADTELVATLAGKRLDLETLWLDSELIKLSASGWADIEALDAELGLGLSTPNLAPVAGAYGIEAAGQINLAAELVKTGDDIALTYRTELQDFAVPQAEAKVLMLDGRVDQSPEHLTFLAEGEGESLRIDRIGPDILPRATLEAEGTLSGDDLDLMRLVVVSPVVEIGLLGTVNLAETSGKIEYRLDTPNLAPIAQIYDVPAGGALSAKGSAILPGGDGAPRVAGDLTASGVIYEGTGYGRVQATHDVLVSESPSGTLDVLNEGGIYGTARVKTAFALEQPVLTLTDLTASALGLTASGNVTANLDGPLAEGELAFSTRDLRGLRAVTGTPLSGRAKGRVMLSAPGGRQDAVLDLTANGLATDGVRISTARLRATLRDLLGTLVIDTSLNATGAVSGDATIDMASVTARGPLSRLAVTVEADGTAMEKPLSASLAGQANVTGQPIRATISRMEAALAEDRVVLNRALQITARGSTVALKGLDVALPGEGRIAGDLTSLGGPLTGDISLSVPDLAILRRLADVPLVSGSLAAEATFDTRRQAAATVSGRNIVFEGVEATGALALDTTLDWQGRVANIAATISGDFGDPLRITAALPVRSGSPVPQLARRGPVSAKVDWTGEIGDLWALVPAPGHIVTGRTVIDLGVSGDISDPQITGGARVEDGGYQNLDAGTILTNLQLGTTLTGDGDLGLDLSASDGATGTVKTTGRFALDASGMDIRTVIDQAVLVRRDDATARIDGNVDVTGPMNALAVAGKITVAEAEVRLVNNNPPSVVTLGDVLIKGAPPPDVDDGSSSVTLDLDIDAPGRIFVRGRGLDSAWGMDLAVRGDAAQPRITGKIERVRGRLDLIGKGFDLKKGLIAFEGGKDIDPRIDVVLERQTPDLTGRIVVDGYASDPQLSFSSSPALPEDEVLPRTIFGKSSQALTGSQAIQLGLGLATLMDGGGGTLDQVRGAVGLDSLRVDQDAEGNASVQAGKEVAEGVWVGTKQALGDGGSSVVVEIDVFDDIQIDTEVEQGGGSSVGIQWKKDF